MDGTRRFWTIASLGLFLAVLGVLLARPLFFVGTAGIGAWLFAHQYWFVNSLAETRDGLRIDQTASLERVSTDGSTEIKLTARRSASPELDLEIEADPPAAATGSTRSDRTLRVARGISEDETTFTLAWPVAGSFEFGSPTVTATDPRALFREQLAVGSAPTVVVEPRVPTDADLYVGEGGTQTDPGMQYGEQLARQVGGGIEPLTIREYTPADEARRIDWHVTARLRELYVREFAVERGQETVLIVDHGSSMGDGTEGETKLDYARAVALGFSSIARDLNTPIGLYTVGDDGVSNRLTPRSSEAQFGTIRTYLFELQPTAGTGDRRNEGIDSPAPFAVVDPTKVARLASRLQDDDTTFGTHLGPFFGTSQTYIRRIDGDPLVETIRTYLERLRPSVLTIIVTDDADRVRTREAVKLARRHSEHVFVFLTPTPLFESDGIVDIEAAYDPYVEFEEFRRGLDALGRVSAFEVAPGERLETILAQAQQTPR